MVRTEISTKLKTQFIPEFLVKMSNALCENEEPLEELIATHRYYFSSLYEEGPEPFLNFQLRWHEHCSAFLLSDEYSLCDVNIEESSCLKLEAYMVEVLRGEWYSSS